MSTNGNILLVANWDSDVGYAWWLMENFWITISRHFGQHNIESHLIYPNISVIPDTILATDIVVSECDLWDHSLTNLRYLRKFIKSKQLKYLYLSDSPFYSPLYLLLRLWGIKRIVVHDHTPGERHTPGLLKSLLKAFVQRIPYFTADHYISVTSYIYDRHIHVNRIPASRCSIAQNGIVPINLDQPDRFYAHDRLGIPRERKIIISTGRASYYKGIDFFIKVADTLVHQQGVNQFHFLFCGDGPDMNDFVSLAHNLQLDEFFTFAGKRSDIRLILPSCYIGFHAATGEVGYSLSILEYMSAGLVSIVPDRPSTSLSISNMETGILYTPGDLDSATNAIRLTLEDGNYERIKQNAIDTVNMEYNIKNTNKQLIDILRPVFN